MKIVEGLILAGRVLVYGGAARALQRLAAEPQIVWAAAVWMTASALAFFGVRNGVREGRVGARIR